MIRYLIFHPNSELFFSLYSYTFVTLENACVLTQDVANKVISTLSNEQYVSRIIDMQLTDVRNKSLDDTFRSKLNTIKNDCNFVLKQVEILDVN